MEVFEDGMDQNYVHATYYSYDIHGNVKTLVQNFPGMTIDGDYQNMQFKRFDYNYDLISGNVHDVYYQLGQRDAWHHHYEYDADNRIIEVYTSKKEVPLIDPRHSITWDNDANYFYYDHGPLARVEIGDNQVQGVDYAYTLQGWLKGVNSNALNANLDMGKDAAASNSPNSLFAKDVFSFSLGYYNGDYEAAGGIAANNWLSDASGNAAISGAHDLWNGNIGVMMTNVIKPAGTTFTGTSNEGLMAGVYQYDQLNRLVSASFVDDFNEATNSWGSNGATDKYKNDFTYDANGNILTQMRRGESGQMVDDLVYHYHNTNGQIVQNRLYSVDDLSGVSGDGDMSDMPTFNNSGSAVNELNNYTYTEIGELKSDAAEEIEEIIWRVDSKISEIIRTSTSVKENLKFEYDAMGNRIAKHVYDELGVLQHSTFYVRDAQGNVMAVYEQEVTAPEEGGPPTTPSISYHLTERHIYGSARLGMDRTMVEMAPTLIQAYPLEPTIPATEESERYLGRKYYELSNHLGNVLTVITDEKRMILDGNNYSHYESVVVSVTDYSPFGVSLTGRTFTTTEGYRYGFQNQETDKELWDGAVTYKYRIEDVRLGRFFSVDPLYAKYPWNSTYAFSENRLIDALELEGAECVLKIDVESFMEHGIICLDVSDALEVTATYSYGLYNITATISAEGATSEEIESYGNFDNIRSRVNLYLIRDLCDDVGKMFCGRLTNFNNSKQKFQPYNMEYDISGLNDTYRHLLGVTLSVLVNGIGDTRYFFEAHERFEEKEGLKVHDVNFIADLINNEIAIEFSKSILDDFCQKSDVTNEKVCQMINTLGSRVMDQYWSSEFADGEDSVIGYFEFTTDDKIIKDVADFLKSNLPEEGE